MSLKPQSETFVPTDTLRVTKAVFTQGNPYVTINDELGPIFEDTDFTELFSKVGQSAIPPWRLALVTIMQFRENGSVTKLVGQQRKANFATEPLMGFYSATVDFDQV